MKYRLPSAIGRFLPLGSVVLTLACASAFAESVPPAFPEWTPEGWQLIASAQGDLDKDGIDDAVLILQQTDPANRVANDGMGAPTLNLNPRRLQVLLGSADGYRLDFSDDRFLPTEHAPESPCLADPLMEGGVAIRRGVIEIGLVYWLSCGSWETSHDDFKFRREDGRYRLIGLDSGYYMRNSGEQVERSINFLTRRKKTVSGLNMFDDSESRPQTHWKTLDGSQRYYLGEITSQCDWADANSWCSQ